MANLTLFVGTAGGGIWKSQNGGLIITFQYLTNIVSPLVPWRLSRVMLKWYMQALAKAIQEIQFPMETDMYKTTDGGNNWQKIGLDSTERISKILINPTDKKTVYVSAPGPLWNASSTHRGLYKTIDGGKTWNKILYVNEETGCADIAMHPTKPETLFASMWQFRRKAYAFSSGGSRKWITSNQQMAEKLGIKLPTDYQKVTLGRIVITINPSKPSEVLAIVEAKVPGLYISEDEGATWVKN